MRPVPRVYPVTNPFGRRGNYTAGYHTGVDYGCPVGTWVRSPRRGRVIESGYDPDYGHFVIVRGWAGYKAFMFAHLSRRLVEVGDKVKYRQIIGHTGDSGNSSGPHLHAEQRHRPFGYWDHERPTAFSPSR